MNNLVLNGAKAQKFRSIEDILKDQALKAKLNNLVDEAVRCKLRIQNEQETIKDLRNVARDELSLNPKLFNLYVNSAFNNDYVSRKTSLEEQLSLIDAVIGLPAADE